MEITGTKCSSQIKNLVSDYPNTSDSVTKIEYSEKVEIEKEIVAKDRTKLDTIPNFKSCENLVQSEESSDDFKLVKTIPIDNSITGDKVHVWDEKCDEKCTTSMKRVSNTSLEMDQNLSLISRSHKIHSMTDPLNSHRIDTLDGKGDEKCITPMKNVSNKPSNSEKKTVCKKSNKKGEIKKKKFIEKRNTRDNENSKKDETEKERKG